jgi:hypothetical protein
MSSAGLNPLAIIAPDLYAKQLAIQRRQALAQSLLEQGQAPTGSAVYGGLRNAGNAILGAILAKRGDQDMANLYAPQQAPQAPQAQTPPPSLATQDVPEPQVSNNSGSGPTMAQPPAGNPALGAALQNKPPAPVAAPQSPQTIPQAMNSAITTLPGMSPQQSMLEFFGNNAQYWKALNDSNALTDQQKQIAAAFPNDPLKQAQALQGIINKAGTTTITRGMGILPSGERVYAPGPAPTGYMNQEGPGGPNDVQVVPMQGGQAAVAGNSFATNLGRAATTPATGYADNMPVASNAAVMSGNAPAMGALGIGPGQPGAQAPAPPANPQPSFRMQNPGATIGGIIGAPVQISSADRSPQHNAVVGGVPDSAHLAAGQAYDFVPQGISSTEAAQRLAKSGLPFDQIIDEGDHVHVSFAPAGRGQVLGKSAPAPANGPGLLPELPPGAETFAEKMAGSTETEWQSSHDMAADVPTRLNVLQNIMTLSKDGAPTGSAEWLTATREARASLQQLLGGNINWNDPAAVMTEIHKYMGQYSNRMAETGNETDAKRYAAEIANPNPDMFPSTLQRVVPWLMANEKAVAAKANYLDAQPGALNNHKAQIAAQNSWRNLYSPRIAQFEMMSPQQQAGYLNDPRAFKSPQDRTQFIKSALALHPYFGQ